MNHPFTTAVINTYCHLGVFRILIRSNPDSCLDTQLNSSAYISINLAQCFTVYRGLSRHLWCASFCFIRVFVTQADAPGQITKDLPFYGMRTRWVLRQATVTSARELVQTLRKSIVEWPEINTEWKDNPPRKEPWIKNCQAIFRRASCC